MDHPLVKDLYFFDDEDKKRPPSELGDYLLRTRVLAAINYIKEQLEDPTIDQPVSMVLRVLEARLVVGFFKVAGLETESALTNLDEKSFAEIQVHPPGGLPGYIYTPDAPEVSKEAEVSEEKK